MTILRNLNPAPRPTEPSSAHRGLVLLVIAGASLMIVLDATIVNVALPSMGRYFQRNQTDMTWAVNAYTLAVGGLLLLGGRAGDIFGRRRMIMLGLALFSLGSLAAGLATSFDFLLGARAVQGVGAAIAAPTALSLITTEFEEGPVRNRAIAVYTAVSLGGAAIGLVLGGLLTDYLSWRWVLFVNAPVGLALIIAAYYFIGESERLPGHIDYVGSAVSVAGLGALVFGFVHAADHGWHGREATGAIAVGVVLLAAFVLYETSWAPEPIMPLRLLRDRNRSCAYLVILVVGAAVFGLFYFITFFAQGVLGYSPLETGLAFLPAVALIAASAQASAMLLPKFGPKPLIVGGTILFTGGLAWLSRIGADAGYADTLLPVTVLIAIGLGAVLVPLTTVVTSRVSATDAGLASALLNVGQQLGGSIGLAVLANVASNTASSSATSEAHRLVATYGLSAHISNFISLGEALIAGTPEPGAARSDSVALHAINTVQAHAAGAGFLTAALFGAGAIAVSVVGIRTRRTERSALDDVDGQPAA